MCASENFYLFRIANGYMIGTDVSRKSASSTCKQTVNNGTTTTSTTTTRTHRSAVDETALGVGKVATTTTTATTIVISALLRPSFFAHPEDNIIIYNIQSKRAFSEVVVVVSFSFLSTVLIILYTLLSVA